MKIQSNHSPCVIGEQRPVDPRRTCLFQDPRSYPLYSAIRSETNFDYV